MNGRFIATGPPGSGKSTTLALLTATAQVGREAATDINAEILAGGVERPELEPDFLTRIVSMQRARRLAADGRVQLHDRSVLCTLALTRYLGRAEPANLAEELAIARTWFEPAVFYFDSLGFVTPTPGRRITLADAIAFGEVHRQVYEQRGFNLVTVSADDPATRAEFIARWLNR